MDNRRIARGEGQTAPPAMSLFYGDIPLARLLSDVAALAQGLEPGAFLRAYTDAPDAWDTLPTLCARHGLRLLDASDPARDERVGGRWSQGRYSFDIALDPSAVLQRFSSGSPAPIGVGAVRRRLARPREKTPDDAR